MPTDNPKISLYVPQQIYDRFKSFQEERKLSMSQAGIVILAEYFGMEETIKEFTEGTTVGGVSLADFEELKQEVFQLKQKVDQIRTTSGLLNRKQLIVSKPQLELLSELDIIKPIPASHLCVKRFGLGKATLSSYKRKHSPEELTVWTKEKDPDNIAWVMSSDKKGYVPESNLSGELLSKLQIWIDNTTI